MQSPLSREAKGAGHSPGDRLQFLTLRLPSLHPPGLGLGTHVLTPLDFLQLIRAAILAGTGAAAEIRTEFWDQVVFASRPAELTMG